MCGYIDDYADYTKKPDKKSLFLVSKLHKLFCCGYVLQIAFQTVK